MTVEPYQPHLKPEWDMVVEQSRNGTFLHRRDYMDYHADRFEDMSLIARDDSGRIIAVMPAHRCGDTVTSHGGLTYGGWLMTPRADMIAMTEVWMLMTALLADMGIARLIYRPVPHIYHKYPAEEDLYALWRAGGRLDRTLVSSVIDVSEPLSFDMSARQSVRKAMRSGVTVRESDDWAGFGKCSKRGSRRLMVQGLFIRSTRYCCCVVVFRKTYACSLPNTREKSWPVV